MQGAAVFTSPETADIVPGPRSASATAALNPDPGLRPSGPIAPAGALPRLSGTGPRLRERPRASFGIKWAAEAGGVRSPEDPKLDLDPKPSRVELAGNLMAMALALLLQDSAAQQ